MFLRTYQNNDQVTRFLRGLSDSFTSVRSQIMLVRPLSKLSEVFALILQQ